jgi:hypothetical protein
VFTKADRILLHAKLDNIMDKLAGTSLMGHDQRSEDRDKEMQADLNRILSMLIPTRELQDALPMQMFNELRIDRIGRIEESQEKLLAVLNEILATMIKLVEHRIDVQ